MDKVRYKVREVLDKNKIEAFLQQARIGHLGMADGHLPYVVPLNFVWTNGVLYFHGATGGRRNQVMEENPEVCFTVCDEYGTITNPVPAKTDTAYMSVMVFGKAQPIFDLDEATHMLQEMINKYVPGYYNRPLSQQHVDKYRSAVFGGPVQVYRIDPQHITAKENPIALGEMFNIEKIPHT
ncbi:MULTISPECIES: pyridoxamine 5'-phosphate oxidase family protein [Lysinibacillus]|uniref:Pyridoxamine 5'-phosphate oxidase family protein n=1 Tax=Lysinibacillus capsici TaxID=2115968 RepID=A0ABY8KIQ0_9BACI|nr:MULTISPECIES: pyridoxamine 5'-phosphate oxidase family protein [Lysinibacillus]MCT1538463.1 pyridoxamine 5'-phosphate oxidase family protein [Lysinibacillus capsici]MCT1569171.1 pyridoxamine 5'-phosphate oxidase family protein [Lysinibacillus capsici]MCT1646186.1 pyridoxamine 5'-phosphate oxidase family protein [Lysinibacillus capsici]MCT1725308.1 pyridoxamine 5'-phosphate oxidase family protein [Lysinibacillus capsici]MCT1784088.1 pyridoxamine 5'-phosphate oxidase family protein [Lysinibac